jgi:hypothetical protein
MNDNETLLEYLFRCGKAAGMRPAGNTHLRMQVARFRNEPNHTAAQSIALQASQHPDPQVRAIAAQLQEALAS